MTSTAVRGLGIDPIRDGWSGPRGSPAAPAHTSRPSRTTPPTIDGNRPAAWAWSRAACRPSGLAVMASGERFRRRAGADEVAIAVGLVDPRHRRPVLVRVETGREHRGRDVVGQVLGDHVGRVWRAAQRRALGTPLPRSDLVDLTTDRDHRLAEPVEL